MYLACAAEFASGSTTQRPPRLRGAIMFMRFLNNCADEKGEFRLARKPAGTEIASDAPTKKAKNQPVKSSSPKLCLTAYSEKLTSARTGSGGFPDL